MKDLMLQAKIDKLKELKKLMQARMAKDLNPSEEELDINNIASQLSSDDSEEEDENEGSPLEQEEQDEELLDKIKEFMRPTGSTMSEKKTQNMILPPPRPPPRNIFVK